MKKNDKRVLCFSVAVLSALILAALCGLPAAAQQTPTGPKVLSNAVANEPIHFDVSRPLTELRREAPAQQGRRSMHATIQPKLQKLTGAQQGQVAGAAGAIQPLIAPPISATIGLGFEGVGQIGGTLDCPSVSGFFLVPPDTNAAVGDTQVVQWVNVCYAVFDKSTGALIAGPFAGTNFWKGFGGPCETNNDGDIIIQWDKSNHRWLAPRTSSVRVLPTIRASQSRRLPTRRAVTSVTPSRSLASPTTRSGGLRAASITRPKTSSTPSSSSV